MRSLPLGLALALLPGTAGLARATSPLAGTGRTGPAPAAVMNAAANNNNNSANTTANNANTTANNANTTTTTNNNGASTTTTTTTNGAATTNGAVNASAPGNGVPNLPPPPPASVTIPPFAQGVPPTPAPAFPGLPAPSTSAATPNSTGLPSQTINDLRQTQNTSGPVDVSRVQLALTNSGFYHGPIDGVLSGPVRGSVRAFQEASGLLPTGQLDPQTVAALGVSAFAPAAQTPSGLAGAASPTANGTTTMTTGTPTVTVNSSGSLNTAGGMTATPTPGVPVIPSPGVAGGGATPRSVTTSSGSEPFPLSSSRPIQPSPLFVQP